MAAVFSSLAVVVQAGAIALTIAGLFTWIARDGGVLDAATLESGQLDYPEIIGFVVHGMNGMIVIPALALVLLIASFFAKVPRGVLWAVLLVVAIVVQVLLGVARVPGLAGLHGVNALIVFALAIAAGQAARAVSTTAASRVRAGAPSVV